MQAVLGSPEGGKQVVVIRCSESAMKISGRAREGLMTGPCPPAAKHAGEGGEDALRGRRTKRARKRATFW